MKFNKCLGLVWVTVLIQIAACGPMNKKPSNVTSGLNGGDPSMISEAAVTKKHVFMVGIEPAEGSTFTPKVDDNVNLAFNNYVVSFEYRVGQKLVTKGNLTVDYDIDGARGHKSFNAKVTSLPDGTFLVTFRFKHTGLWNLHFHFVDGDLKDDFDESITL